MSTQHEEKNKKATFPSNEKFQIFKHILFSVATIEGKEKNKNQPLLFAQNFLI